jgi:hypothetical protein
VPDCPQPTKRRFANRENAVLASGEFGKSDLNTYLCVCGWWHLTKKNSNGRASEEVIQVLLDASDKEFASLVRAELSGNATPDEVAALRSDELVARWKRALDALLVESEEQLSSVLGRDDPFSKEWRRRRHRWAQQVTTRRKEVVPLLNSLYMRRTAERRAQGPRVPSPRNRAINRLIEAHQEEFDRLVREEEGRT